MRMLERLQTGFRLMWRIGSDIGAKSNRLGPLPALALNIGRRIIIDQ
jgi:hypothetical protein